MELVSAWLGLRLELHRGIGSLIVLDYPARILRPLLSQCVRRGNILQVSVFHREPWGKPIYPVSRRRGRILYPVLRHGELVWVKVCTDDPRGFQDIVDCLSQGLVFEAWGHVITLRLVRIDHLARYDGSQPLVDVAEGSRLRVRLYTPTHPVSPWHASRHRRFTVKPSSLFYTAALILTGWDAGKARLLVERLEASVSPAPYTWSSLRIVYYLHAGRLIPGLVGSYTLFVRDPSIVEHLATVALLAGVGAGRAAGFGVAGVEVYRVDGGRLAGRWYAAGRLAGRVQALGAAGREGVDARLENVH